MKQDNRDNSRNWQTTNTGGTNYTGEIHFHGSEPNSPMTRQEYRNRQALLNKVKNFWVKDVLEKSLYNQVLISLGLEERLDAVANPWSMVLETGDSSPQPLLQGTKVIDIFDQIGAGRTLLILGEPGAGKTTTLLELTRDLITRAEQDADHLIPVVFNLSSWAVQRQKLADWLMEELKTKYDIPKEIRQDWVKKQQLLPLLDGLDEVKAEYRNDCITALNQFKQDNGAELVVCSRIKDYEILSNRLNFQSAVYLRPLTLEQVRHYLDSAGAELIGLRELFAKDTALQELSQSPLMLNIMTLAYQGVAVEDLPHIEVVEERRKQLFDDYIQKMFHRPNRSKGEQTYLEEQTRRWLSWLAHRMIQESQSVFLIERMQPTWLEDKRYKLIYRLSVGLSVGLFFEPIGGLIGGLIGGVIGGLIGGVIGGSSVELSGEIRTAENLQLNWKNFWRNGLRGGLITGLIFGSIFGQSTGLMGGLIFGLSTGLIFGLSTGLIFGLMGGLESSEIETKISPNQGISKSLQNAVIVWLMFGLMFGLSAGLMFGLIVGYMGELIDGLIFGLIFGLMFGLTLGLIGGLMFGLRYGGAACIQHFILRLILYCQGHIPWNYARFLDYATNRLFLQRVGGGYRFMHRLLQEHFAANYR